MKKSIYNVIILLMVAWILTSCDNLKQSLTDKPAEGTKVPVAQNIGVKEQDDMPNTSLSVVNGCIQPFETFSYTVYDDPSKPFPRGDDRVYPEYPWVIEGDVELGDSPDGLLDVYSKVAGTRVVNNQVEIWIENLYLENRLWVIYQTYSVYKPGTKEFRTIPVEYNSSDGLYYFNSRLIFDKNGTIWAVVDSHDFSFEVKEPTGTILGKFNEENDSFEFDSRTDAVPIYRKSITDRSHVLIDQNQNLWFVEPNGSIHLFNTATGLLETKFSTPYLGRLVDIYGASEDSLTLLDATFAPDGSLYLYIYFFPGHKPSIIIVQYFPDSNQFKKLNLPLEIEYSSYQAIKFDHEGNLWLDASAWMDPDGSWSQIILPDIFITNFAEGQGYRLRVPKITGVSSDGRLWFEGDNGAYWLNKQEQKWCWFTTKQVTPIEDVNGTLWLVIDGKIYRSSIE